MVSSWLAAGLLACGPEKDPVPQEGKDWTAYHLTHLVSVQTNEPDGEERVDSLRFGYDAAGKISRIDEYWYSRELNGTRPADWQRERHQLVYGPNGRLQEINTEQNQRISRAEPDQWTPQGRLLCEYDGAGRLVNLIADFQGRQEKHFQEVAYAPEGWPVRIVPQRGNPVYELEYDARGNAYKSRQRSGSTGEGYERTFTFNSNPNPFRLLGNAGYSPLHFFRAGGDLGWNYQYAVTSRNNPLTIQATSLGGTHGPLLNPSLVLQYRYNAAGLPLEARIGKAGQPIPLKRFRFYYQ